MKKFKQLLINLIGNGLKFTNKGGIKVTMTQPDDMTANQFDKLRKIYIEVSDTGVGMKAKDMKNLFKLFGQAKDRFNMNKNGTGLGLHICKQIVEGLGGKIKAESELGTGTSFKMWMKVEIGEDKFKPDPADPSETSNPVIY